MAYFLLTLLVTAAIIFWIPVVGWFTVLIVYLCMILLPIGGHFLMKKYAYAITRTDWPKKPRSRLGLYLPVVFPMMWYLFWTAQGNLSGALHVVGGPSDLLFALFSVHSYGMFAGTLLRPLGLEEWHAVLIMNLLYDGVIIWGFARGELLSAQKLAVKPIPLSHHKKFIAVFLAVVISAYAYSEYVLYDQRRNIVSSASRPSYNFRFENGYSSIDLSPYKVENPENILANLDEASTFRISDVQKMPILDGAEAAYPVYSAFANTCYVNIGEIQTAAKEYGSSSVTPVQFSNTIYAYEKLLSGEIDIFFGAYPSSEQRTMASAAGVELVYTPIGREAFVFFVNEDNPVSDLSSQQLRDIYSGKINNWRWVGGKNRRILPFQRPANSGSQTMMEYFMGTTPLREPLEYEERSAMEGIVRGVAEYNNSSSALGYSFRYYITIMMSGSGEEAGVKILAVDGVYPDEEAIWSGEYPYTTELYAITVAGRTDAKKDTIEAFLAWMTGPQGQQIVVDTGYVAVE